MNFGQCSEDFQKTLEIFGKCSEIFAKLLKYPYTVFLFILHVRLWIRILSSRVQRAFQQPLLNRLHMLSNVSCKKMAFCLNRKSLLDVQIQARKSSLIF